MMAELNAASAHAKINFDSVFVGISANLGAVKRLLEVCASIRQTLLPDDAAHAKSMMKVNLARTLLVLAAAAFLAQGSRVKQGLLFEYDFAQSQCARGAFNDTLDGTSLLGALQHSSSDPLRCPPMGALYRPTRAGTYLSELTASSLFNSGRVPTEVAGAGTRPRQYTIEMWFRGSALLDRRGKGRDEVTLFAIGETSPYNGGIRVERRNNQVLVNDKVVVADGAYCQGGECDGWDANVTHLVVRVSNEAAGRVARVNTRWRTKSGSGVAASIAAAGGTAGQSTITEKAWGLSADGRLSVAREVEFPTVSRSTGLLYLVAMYNRALTDAEVVQNFEAWHPEATALRVPEDGLDHLSGAPWTVALTCTDPLGFIGGNVASAPLPPPNPLYNASEGARVRVTSFSSTPSGVLFDSPPASPAKAGAGAGLAAGNKWVAGAGPLTLTSGAACTICTTPSAGFGVRYVPPPHKFGTAVVALLSYQVFKNSDSGGGTEIPISGCVSDSEARAFDVFEVNDAPSHREAAATAKVTVGVPKTFDLTQIAGGAFDVEGDAITGVLVTARNGTHDTYLTVTGTSVSVSYPVSQQALAAFNGAGVVDTIVLDVQLLDDRGAQQAAPGTAFTIDVLNYLQAVEEETSTVSENTNTVLADSAPNTVKDAFMVTLSGRDFALQSRKLRFEVDRAALPASGKLYQLVRANNGNNTIEYGEQLTPGPVGAWITIDNVGPADANGITRAFLVYLPNAGEFTSPSLTAGTPAGGRELFVPRAALANSSECGASAGATCALRFRVTTDDGARSKPESHALAIENVPNAPDVAIELAHASSASTVNGNSKMCIGAGTTATGQCDVAALQSVPLLSFTKWIDHDHDACEWRAEISAAQGSVYFSDLAALDGADFRRSASVGDGVREARRLVFFAMPSRMRRVLSSLTYFDTAESSDTVTISLSNTACAGEYACASTTMSLALNARRTAADLEKALGHAKDGKPQYLIIPGTSAAVTSIIFVSVVLVLAFSCAGYWRRKAHDLRVQGTCCAVTLDHNLPGRARTRDSNWSSLRSDSASEPVSTDFIVPDSGRSDDGNSKLQIPPWKDQWEITEHPDYPGSKMYVNTRTQEAQWQAPQGIVFENGVGIANPLSMGSPTQQRIARHGRPTQHDRQLSRRTTSSNSSSRSQRADI